MIPIEFHTEPFGEDILTSQGGSHRTFSEKDTELIKYMYAEIESRYPESFKRMHELYGHSADFRYLMVRRFVKCNFGLADEKADIDHDGNWNLEKVKCPLRGGFCSDENQICNPSFNCGLTPQETKVLKRIVKPTKTIAQELYITQSTVENHIASIKLKLKLNTVAELTEYVVRHNYL